ITVVQPVRALPYDVSILRSSVSTENPEKTIYCCPEVQCSAAAASVLPARDGPKGAKGEQVQRTDDLQRQVTALETEAQVLEAELNGHKKIRKVGEKILASNGKKADFVSALQSCEEVGGTLAAPKNEEENKAIMDFVKQYNQYAYLGITKGEDSGQVKYLNGMPVSYSNWHQHEPNGKGKEKCVEMYTDGTWNDKKCNMYRLTICEF
uniref:Uncharacterized protein n=1 Tax=Geospiza parvula TaxID=87175 RepID=A0A8C3M747_GEOPR